MRGVPALAALAPEAETHVAAGNAATLLRDNAQQANRTFRDVGERKQFIDKLNANRKEIHGALAKLPFEHPNLPTDFADGFFYSEAARDLKSPRNPAFRACARVLLMPSSTTFAAP